MACGFTLHCLLPAAPQDVFETWLSSKPSKDVAQTLPSPLAGEGGAERDG